MLVEVIERRSPVTNRKSTIYVLSCDACHARIEASKCRVDRTPDRHFCDTKCMGRHKREHPEAWPNNSAARNTPEACAKATASKRRKWASGEMQLPWLGKHHSEETKQRLSEMAADGRRKGEGNGMFGRHHSEDARSKMSEAKSRDILAGTFRAYGTRNKKGDHVSTKTNRTHFYRSGWEQALMVWLDSNPDVLTWDYECVRIPYVYNDNKRWYVPDFVVNFVDGRREMWEVKPEEFLQTDRVVRCTAAGEQYCQENDIKQYRHITRAVLQSLNVIT